MLDLHKRFLDSATIGLFVLALLAPAIDQCLRPDTARDCLRAERRLPEPRPDIPHTLAEFTSFPRRYEAHYTDTFGLRDVLLRWNSTELWLGLGLSPSARFEHGGDEWFFLGTSRENFRGVRPFREEELEGLVAQLRERRDFLQAQGVGYLYVIIPDKETIYPERTPATWKKLGRTRLEQLLARLQREPDLPVLDLTPALLAAKAEDAPEDWVYTSLGTHWNGRGAYAAYRAIIERLRRDFPALDCVPRAACRVIEGGSADNIAEQLYLDDLLQQRLYVVAPADLNTYEVLYPSSRQYGARLVTRKEGSAPRLLWLHDSFGFYIEALMCASFSFVQAHWVHDFPAQSLHEARPDVVIEAHGERLLIADGIGPIVREAEPLEALFERFTDVAWSAAPEAGFDPAQALGNSSVERRGGELHLVVTGLTDGLLLPPLAAAPGAQALVRIEGACTKPTAVEIHVRAAGTRNFLPKNLLVCELSPERPSAVVRLPSVGPRFEVLVRYSGTIAGFDIRALEVRRGARGD